MPHLTGICTANIHTFASLRTVTTRAKNRAHAVAHTHRNQLRMTTLSLNLSLPQLNQSHNPNNSTIAAPLLAAANSQFQLPKRRSIHTNNRTSGFSWMGSTVGEKVQSTAGPTSVPVRVAHELLQAGHRYLDVRTADEYSAGHAVGAINIPYMFRVGSGMTKNPNFLEEVLSHFRKDDEIIVGCQAGKRSLMAATDLLSVGFTGITDIAGGYATWTQNGLPTES